MSDVSLYRIADRLRDEANQEAREADCLATYDLNKIIGYATANTLGVIAKVLDEIEKDPQRFLAD